MSDVKGFVVTSTILVVVDGVGYRVEEVIDVTSGEANSLVYKMLPTGIWVSLIETDVPDSLREAATQLVGKSPVGVVN